VKRPAILAALGVALAAGAAITAGPADAFVTSASVDRLTATATLNLAGTFNSMTVSVSRGLLVHDQTTPTGGLESGADWDSTRDGDQTVPADGTFTVVVNGGAGPDALTVLAQSTEVATVALNGEGGDDALIGADSDDTLDGGDGNDRLAGAPGADVLNGGPGNDTLVWNDPDGSDTVNGDDGDDLLEVNGSPTRSDAFLLQPAYGRVLISRLNLKTAHLDTSTERVQVNGLGGSDLLDEEGDVSGLTRLSVDGGPGADTITGTDGPDAIRGGDGGDVLDGGGGDDRIAGDAGDDTIHGGAGDDTAVWSDGDGSDVIDGDDGRDDVEVDGSPTQGDLLTVQRNAARIRLDRLDLVPFSLDIGSSETLHADGLGGDDEIAIGDTGALSVTADGGAGDDSLAGGGSPDTLLGGSGDDVISGGGGIDVVSGDDGDDFVFVRDGVADLARGGAGSDTVIADPGLDILDGFETVHAPPVTTPPVDSGLPAVLAPPPALTPRPTGPSTLAVTIGRGTVKVSRRTRTASLALSCPAAARAHCAGSLALRTAKAVTLAGRTRVLELGHARYDLRPGGSATVKLKLAAIATRVADRSGRINVLATASTGSAQRLTLALAR
jgi:Ca2+-binding RTX toxin-like protein